MVVAEGMEAEDGVEAGGGMEGGGVGGRGGGGGWGGGWRRWLVGGRWVDWWGGRARGWLGWQWLGLLGGRWGARLWLGWLLSLLPVLPVLSVLSVRCLGRLLTVRSLESHEDIKVGANLLSFVASWIRATGASASTETSNYSRLSSTPALPLCLFLSC